MIKTTHKRWRVDVAPNPPTPEAYKGWRDAWEAGVRSEQAVTGIYITKVTRLSNEVQRLKRLNEALTHQLNKQLTT